MLDLEKAREVVAAREQERIDALVNEEAANAAHRAAQAATGQMMIESQQRIKQEKIARHAELRAVARHHKDHLAELVQQREQIELGVGRLRADLGAAQRNANRCTPPSPDDFPLPSELDAWKQRRAELDREAARIAARIGTEQAELDRAKFAEWEAEAVFQRAREAEMDARI
jgi:hypothetical protein